MDAPLLSPGSTLITGNTRLARQLLREYDAAWKDRGERLWESPDVLPHDAWLRRAWTESVYRDAAGLPLLLDAQQERVLWEQAIASSSAAGDLLSIPPTAGMAAEAWELMHTWELPRAPAEFEGLPDAEAFFGWMETVERRLLANHWLTASQLPEALLQNVAYGGMESPHGIYYAGFDELAPADRRLFEAMGAREFPTGSSSLSRAVRAGFEDTTQEIAHAAAWARSRLEHSPDARIGIVVRGLSAVRAMVERTFDDIFHPGLDFARAGAPRAFHISAGPPVADAPLISTALLILRLADGLPLAEAGMLARSPFLKLSSATGPTGAPASSIILGSALDAEWRRQGVTEVSARSPAIERLFPGFTRTIDSLPARSFPSQWSTVFSRLLARVGWPGPRTLSHAEFQAIERWNRLLSDFAKLDVVIPNLEFSEAVARLRRMATENQFTPEDEGDAPVQIMDILEAAGSRFDSLWVAGLHGGVWPQPSRPNPFLPLSLQRAADAPQSSADRELKYARLVTGRLLRSAPQVIFSYPKFSREETLRISPLIATLPQADAFAEPGDFPPPAPTVDQVLFSARPRWEIQPLGNAPTLPPGTLQSGGMKVIEDQAACPFRAFAVHRLNARELDAPAPGLSPIERGNVAHAALELIWSELRTQQTLLAYREGEIRALLRKSIRAALERVLKPARSSTLRRFQVLEEQRLLRLLTQWLDVERERPPFEVMEAENARTAELGGLRLQIKVDRVDRYLSDGRHAILDYKTAKKLSPADWDGDRPDAPQLPLYATRYSTEETGVSSVMFAKLVIGDTRLIGISESGEDAGRQRKNGPLAERISDWRRVMDALALSFREGNAAVNPKKLKQTCRYCDLGPLCRVAELNRTWIEDEETEENDG